MKKIEELETIVKESGLQLSEGEAIKKSYAPFFDKMAVIKEEAKKINFENPTDLDEDIAKKLRLRTVKIRTGSEQIKNERKKVHSLKANLEQSAWNLIKSTCQLDEEMFAQVEKRKEIARQKEAARLQEERRDELSKYGVEVFPENLGSMEDAVWTNFLTGTKVNYEQQIQAEKDAEKAKLAEEAKAKLINDRRIELAPYSDFIRNFDKALNMDEVNYKKGLANVKKLKKDHDDKQEKIRLENEKLKAEAAKKEELTKKRSAELQPYIVFIRDYNGLIAKEEKEYKKEFSDIKKGAEEHWKFEREKKEKESKDKEALLEKQRKEKEMSDFKIKEAKEKAQKAEERLRKKEQIEAAKKLKEKEAFEAELKKGDDEKMTDLIVELTGLKTKYEFKSAKSKALYVRFGAYIDQVIPKLK